MKYIIGGAYRFFGKYSKYDVDKFLTDYADFSISVSDKLDVGSEDYYNVFVDIDTIEELYNFVRVSKFPIMFGEDPIEYQGKKYPTLIMLEGYMD